MVAEMLAYFDEPGDGQGVCLRLDRITIPQAISELEYIMIIVSANIHAYTSEENI